MQDKSQCPWESSVKQADRCHRRSLRQNTTKGDTAEASWFLGSLGHIARGRSVVGLSPVFLVSCSSTLFSNFMPWYYLKGAICSRFRIVKTLDTNRLLIHQHGQIVRRTGSFCTHLLLFFGCALKDTRVEFFHWPW